MKTKLSILLVLISSTLSFSQTYKNKNAAVEDRVEDVLSKMTLEEKIDYIGGFNSFYIREIPRLNLPLIKMADGSIGVRNYGNTTAYPASILSSATWDINLVNSLGQALGKDARSRGVHILLAPGVNIHRAPMCARNFEYLGEDPYLSGRMATEYIKGVQSQKVVATVKHYAANNQEWDRHHVSSDIDERTLHEIYLPAFKAAVQEGKVGAVMNSYNLINGVHATQNNYLNNEILKKQYGFDGILMSDWRSTYNGVAAAKGGLDLEMPFGVHMCKDTLLPAIKSGILSEEMINEKVRRILRIIFRFGFFDNAQTDNSIPLDNPDNAKVALNLARNGIVLLKNQDHILPLAAEKVKTIAVIGPNADGFISGGGSAYTLPFHAVSTLQGIQTVLGANASVKYFIGVLNEGNIAPKSIFYTTPGSSTRGLIGTYYKNRNLTEPSAYTRTDQIIDFHWSADPDIPGFPTDSFSIRWTGVVRPEKTDSYEFIFAGDDGFKLWINNELIIDDWRDKSSTVKKGRITLKGGQEYSVKLEYYDNVGRANAALGWKPASISFDESLAAAKGADAVILCVGFNMVEEKEGGDRTFEMSNDQDSLINAIAKVNPNTIVIINAGGNVSMTKWINNVKGLLYAWYPGQEGGTAIAEILFGKVNPSGKLPVSFEKKWEDNPTYKSYYSDNKKVTYSEGVFVGYRYYDSKKVEPLFPFGFGLSYTTFKYSNLVVTPIDNAIKYTVSFDIQNTGAVEGSEIAQVYVHELESKVPRPFKELKGFSKISLKPGESKTVTITLPADAFAYYKTDVHAFVVDKGEFQILVGGSSKDIKLTKNVVVKNNFVVPNNSATSDKK